MIIFLCDQLGVGRIFNDFIIIFDGCGSDRVPKFFHNQLGDWMVGNADTYCLIAFVGQGQTFVCFENECERSRDLAF